MRTRTPVYTHTATVYTYLDIYTQKQLYRHAYSPDVQIHTHSCTQTHIYTHAQSSTDMRTHPLTYTRIHTPPHTQTHTATVYTDLYLHPQMHTDIHRHAYPPQRTHTPRYTDLYIGTDAHSDTPRYVHLRCTHRDTGTPSCAHTFQAPPPRPVQGASPPGAAERADPAEPSGRAARGATCAGGHAGVSMCVRARVCGGGGRSVPGNYIDPAQLPGAAGMEAAEALGADGARDRSSEVGARGSGHAGRVRWEGLGGSLAAPEPALGFRKLQLLMSCRVQAEVQALQRHPGPRSRGSQASRGPG